MKIKQIIASIIFASFTISFVSNNFIAFSVNSDFDMYSQEQKKISSDLLETIQKNSDETYPVIIWGNGIENSEIENIVKDEIGYDLEMLEEEYIAPSSELIAELNKAAEDSPDTYLEILMKKHLELTASAREIEKKKTDLYRKTRRNILKELNVSRTQNLINELKISNDKINFMSMFAPMTICFLSEDEIISASKNENVCEITLYEPQEYEDCSINLGTTKTTMGIDKINNYLGLTGYGTKIGIYETATVSSQYASQYGVNYSNVTIVGSENTAGSDHPTYCAGIAAGNNGVAPEAEIYSASCDNDWNSFDWNNYNNDTMPTLEALIDSGVDVISVSWGSSYSQYDNWSKYTDYLISETCVTIVCATGNNPNNYINRPATAYNCIAVNGFIDQYNGQNQEILNNYAYNNGNCCLKPDVVGPSLNNGTSTSTPYIAGMIALMYQYRPSLTASPELTKAILIGSCHKKCSKLLNGQNISDLYETMSQGLTDRQGAGIPNLYRMISIVSQHTYGRGALNSDNSYERIVHFIQPSYNSSNINISMAYAQDNVTISSNTSIKDDCDLYVYNNSTTMYSENSNSSTELIYGQLTNNEIYSLRINKYSGPSSEIKYAYAWSTDNEYYYSNYEFEGIFYLRNCKSSYYLTKNTDNNKSTQQNHTNSLNALWVLDYISSSGKYTVKNVNLTSYGLCLGNAIGNNYYYAVDNTTTTVNPISIECNDDKTYTFKQIVGNTTYALGVNNNSTSTGAYAAWYPYNSNNNSQKWYLETANFRLGDVNYDGIINNTDANIIQSYDAGTTTLNNIQKYLADVNKTDTVTISDNVAISQILLE